MMREASEDDDVAQYLSQQNPPSFPLSSHPHHSREYVSLTCLPDLSGSSLPTIVVVKRKEIVGVVLMVLPPT